MKQRLLLLVFCLFPYICPCQVNSQILKLGGAAVQALQTLDSATTDIESVKDVVIQIENGQAPKIKGNKWSSLAEKYRVAANTLRNAPLPTQFDSSPYSFSMQQLKDCATRNSSLQKGKGFVAALQQANANGDAEITKLNNGMRNIAKSKEAVTGRFELRISRDLARYG